VRNVPIYTHWSLPPRHVGYWARLGGGDGWPERGGCGPMVTPHIPGLAPGWHVWHERQHVGLPVRPPYGAMIGQRRRPRRPPARHNAYRVARWRAR